MTSFEKGFPDIASQRRVEQQRIEEEKFKQEERPLIVKKGGHYYFETPMAISGKGRKVYKQAYLADEAEIEAKKEEAERPLEFGETLFPVGVVEEKRIRLEGGKIFKKREHTGVANMVQSAPIIKETEPEPSSWEKFNLSVAKKTTHKVLATYEEQE